MHIASQLQLQNLIVVYRSGAVKLELGISLSNSLSS